MHLRIILADRKLNCIEMLQLFSSTYYGKLVHTLGGAERLLFFNKICKVSIHLNESRSFIEHNKCVCKMIYSGQVDSLYKETFSDMS
jgi:hypothetical protein